MNITGKLVSSSNISNGNKLNISSDCAYVGISLYNVNNDNETTFNNYDNLLNTYGYLVKIGMQMVIHPFHIH